MATIFVPGMVFPDAAISVDQIRSARAPFTRAVERKKGAEERERERGGEPKWWETRCVCVCCRERFLEKKEIDRERFV
jgi:hypothetical protein